jgi:hypothetical protein
VWQEAVVSIPTLGRQPAGINRLANVGENTTDRWVGRACTVAG